MNTNLPEIRKESIFMKIKKWFKYLFEKNTIIEEPIQEENRQHFQNNEVNNLKEKIKIESRDVILSLQRKIDNKEMEITALTDEQLDEMIELYIKQIEERKNKLRYYKKLRKG